MACTTESVSGVNRGKGFGEKWREAFIRPVAASTVLESADIIGTGTWKTVKIRCVRELEACETFIRLIVCSVGVFLCVSHFC